MLHTPYLPVCLSIDKLLPYLLSRRLGFTVQELTESVDEAVELPSVLLGESFVNLGGSQGSFILVSFHHNYNFKRFT